MALKKKKTFADAAILCFLFLGVAMCMIPLLNTLAISFSDKVSAQNGRVFIWPVNFTLAPYGELIKDTQFFQSFRMSIGRVLLGGCVNVGLILITAFPLSKAREQFRAKNRYMWVIIFLMMFPPGLIPSYVLVTKLNLINSIWSLILPGALPIFSCITLMNFYKTIPASLEEAAMMDGAGPWYILLRIYVPLSKPSIAVVALWAIVGHWNDFFSGLIYITNHAKWPLQTYIQSLTVSIDWQNVQNLSGEELARMMSVSNLTFNSAKVVISMIPILCVYPFIQRYFVTGIVLGAVKE